MKTTFRGISGKIYSFSSFDILSSPDVESCVYVYARYNPLGFSVPFIPVYIGYTTRSLRQRLAEHDGDGKNSCASNNGCTNIFVHAKYWPQQKYSEDELQQIEKDLLSAYETPCNIANNTWTSYLF